MAYTEHTRAIDNALTKLTAEVVLNISANDRCYGNLASDLERIQATADGLITIIKQQEGLL